MSIPVLSSMWGRVFSLLLLGVILSASLTGWLAFGEREKTLTQFRENHAIDRIEQLVRALDVLPADNRAQFLATAPKLGLEVTTLPLVASNGGAHSEYARAVSQRLGKRFRVVSLSDNDHLLCPPSAEGKNCEALGITLHDGTNLRMTVLPPRSPLPPFRQDFMQILLLLLVSIGVLAYLIAKMTMRPLQHLAQSAAELGLDINRPPVREQGSIEIRQATHALNAMQARIRQHISQRTNMLAAITHDLQTPVTRLRLRLEKVQDTELRDKLIGDLSAMQMMIREGLDLARSMDSSEPVVQVDLESLLHSLCEDAQDAGQTVRFEGQPGLQIMGRPQALRRCLTNLMDNAVKYGQSAFVRLKAGEQAEAHLVHIYVRDQGPGIPAEYLQQVLEPFFRLESSRSRDSGGTGLGLTIAQNITQQHGGQLRLKNLEGGGLEVRLTLPRHTV